MVSELALKRSMNAVLIDDNRSFRTDADFFVVGTAARSEPDVDLNVFWRGIQLAEHLLDNLVLFGGSAHDEVFIHGFQREAVGGGHHYRNHTTGFWQPLRLYIRYRDSFN